MNILYNKRGQAAVEMAIFGVIVLMVFGTLLSYLQKLNDQQYIQMETFRQSLAKWEARRNHWQVTEEVLEAMQPEHRAIMKHLNDNAKVRYVFMESLNLDIVTKEDYEIELL